MPDLLVLAAPGLLVPREGKPRDYFGDTPPAGCDGYAVPETAYILRRLADGDLVHVAQAQAVNPPKKSARSVKE